MVTEQHPDDLFLRYLVHRKYPDQRRPPFSGPGLEYYNELCDKPAEELEKLLKHERAQEAEEKRYVAIRDDLYHFFSEPEADADFIYWGKMDYWQPDEAIALFSGKDPRVVNWNSIEYLLDRSPFVQEYDGLRDLVERALKSEFLDPKTTPIGWVDWAEEKQITCPTELKEQVEIFNGPRVAWQAASAVKDEAIEKITAERDDLIQQLNDSKEDLSVREQSTLLKMVLGMAIKKYDYAPGERSGTARQISEDLADKNLRVSDDSVRKWLQSAHERDLYDQG